MAHPRALVHLLKIPAPPDPNGWIGFSLLAALLLTHLALPAVAVGHLWSANPWIEALGHVWLLLGPPYALYMGIRHLLCRADSLVPLVTVPLAFFLTLLTGLSVAFAVL